MQSYALEASTLQGASAVVKSYRAWLSAWGLPLSFRAGVIQDWLVDYAREGNCARSLDTRLTALRRYARSLRMPFPAFGSYAWDDLKDTVRACKKIEPTQRKQATVIDVHWLLRVAATVGVAEFSDLWRCSLLDLQLLCRAYVCHCCMLRGCEHRRGLLLSDVKCVRDSAGGVEYYLLCVAERYSNKKKKFCPARQCVLMAEPNLLSAGGVMSVYLERLGVFGGASAGAQLFPLIDPTSGDIDGSKTTTDAQFARKFCALCKVAGMGDTALKKVTNHSFRAGGATDASVGGATETEIAAQGGWTSRALRCYIRPQAHHSRTRAVRMMAAIHAALRTGGGPQPTALTL